ncbi:MAG TPA: SCP2 sterol-binding domain-containing protein [Arenimonas sp.]|nr:SCP2 sterol-binding domain-containing protein [Arenimonas sp.]HPW33944.1 SCP2 sterol-binding domain-containing protein [Arenimonas sp.]
MNTSVSFFDSLKPLAGRALEQALNRVLALDPDTQAAISKLDQRRIQLALEAPAIALEISVDGNQLRVGPVQDGEADLGIRSTISGALSQLPFFRSSSAAPVGKVRINGDAELARQLQSLAKNFDPDWDKPFVEVFGVVIGTQIAKVLREAFKQGAGIAKKFGKDGVDYLTEESRDVVSSAEQAAFNEDVDDLRDRAERVLARFEKLKQTQEPNA